MENVTIEKVLESASRYLKLEKNINIIKEAYELAASKHEGQFRKSGDPYISHPLHVAYMLCELQAGPATIAAGLLHDVVEDTDVTLDFVKKNFVLFSPVAMFFVTRNSLHCCMRFLKIVQ